MLSSAFVNMQTSASIADQKAHSVIGVPKLAPDGQGSGIKPLPAREGKQILKDDREVLPTARRDGGFAPERLVARDLARIRAARPRPEESPSRFSTSYCRSRCRNFPATRSSPTTARRTKSAATTTISSHCPTTAWASPWETSPARESRRR